MNQNGCAAKVLERFLDIVGPVQSTERCGAHARKEKKHTHYAPASITVTNDGGKVVLRRVVSATGQRLGVSVDADIGFVGADAGGAGDQAILKDRTESEGVYSRSVKTLVFVSAW